MQNKPADGPILSVTELNQYSRGVLEMHVGKIRVSGEISNFSRPASGHWYFTLKDQKSQVRCAMFRNRNQFIRTPVANGMQVVLNAGVSLYEGRGDYQLIVDYLEEAGVGSLQRQFELLKARLNNEGLFAAERKQPVPDHPKHIAVITSATGAAVHDILSVLNERYPLLKVTVIPTAVQGEQAARQICDALMRAERWNSEEHDSFDAIILGRGGGSLEDLWPFNEEAVARAISACKIPIISAVGHEVDVTIADYVADVRAPTPSAAAEMISPDQAAIQQQLDYQEQRLHRSIERQLHHRQRQLQLMQQQLRHPGERLQQIRLKLDHLQQTLHTRTQQQLEQQNHRLSLLQQRIQHHAPQQQLHHYQLQLKQLSEQLQKQIQDTLQQAGNRLAQQTRVLEAVSPLATLQRGYAIVSDDRQHVIHDSSALEIGDSVTTQLSEGGFRSTITEIIKTEK